jgi:hypothetical protein
MMKWVRNLYLLPIFVYQRLISPLVGPQCRFQPTCSQYFVDAVRKRGMLIGTVKGTWRILRCHPYSRGGWDPVDPEQPPPWADEEPVHSR